MKDLVKGSLDGRGKLLGLDKARRLKMGHFVLAPGETVPVHVTKSREEVLVMLRGKARVSMGDRVVELVKGEWLYIEPEVEHGVESVGVEGLEYVYVVAMLD